MLWLSKCYSTEVTRDQDNTHVFSENAHINYLLPKNTFFFCFFYHRYARKFGVVVRYVSINYHENCSETSTRRQSTPLLNVVKSCKIWSVERNKFPTFPDKSGWWCPEPEKPELSRAFAAKSPLNRGLGWAPNKTIFFLPGTHLRVYYEQRSGAAGTKRPNAEIILSVISYKYLTEKAEMRGEKRGQAWRLRVSEPQRWGTSETRRVLWDFNRCMADHLIARAD